ncbi:MAG: hypothetical protein JOZ81_14925 [Chloroflexi bacterium]|nr:hypothetical protein [Chloroflexota bacterium]
MIEARAGVWIVAQASGPAAWATEELEHALQARGIGWSVADTLSGAPGDTLRIVIAGSTSPVAGELLRAAGATIPDAPESLGLIAGTNLLLATGSDARGLVYAVLELADIVACSPDPLQALRAQPTIVQRPANPVRGVARLFVSEVEDKPWFYDRDAWRRYLGTLAGHRFNRVQLALGMGVNFLRNITDAYFLFAYPFLISVPGYDVRARGLPDDERERNLQTLRFVSDEAAARGLHFQLGIWMHGYQWVDSPDATYTIEGLTPNTHAAYCREAVRILLQACPNIAGLTLRVHGESGVPEGSYAFWREVFRGVQECGRPVELDLHPKGVDRQMIQVALETGLHARLSPKYTAEHMGLPGHQVEIRPRERAPAIGHDAFVSSLMAESAGALNYTRYGYADFLKEDRPYGVFYRIWPGTQRVLLWGDPALAAGYGRSGGFCGSLGVELCEPLSFKGRAGSGLVGGRDAYADDSLRPADGDWSKYLYTYRLFGRLLYDPDADPACWRRSLACEFGPAATAVEGALASASRILPLVTSAHCPSADNLSYWPEMYTNMPIVDASRPHPYRDTPEPKRFGTVSPLDAGLFVGIQDFVDEVLRGERSARYSPVRVAGWLDEQAKSAREHLSEAERLTPEPQAPAFRRLAADVAVQAQLGRFFAAKLRAGVAYALFERTGEGGWLREAREQCATARSAWAEAAEHGRVYRADVTVGAQPWQRGHWADRLAAIDGDLGDMDAEWTKLQARENVSSPSLASLEADPPSLEYDHVPPAGIESGKPVGIEVRVNDSGPLSVDLHYRHVNQAEAYVVAPMTANDRVYSATIPGEYTDSPYPLQYFFTLRHDRGQPWRYPALTADFANQPYLVIRRRA